MRDVTIALPTLNEEKYLTRCLKSLEERIKEYEGDVELIVLDSHSEDDTVKIAKRFGIVDEIYEVPKGILTAREEGFKRASHEIIVSVDADAFYSENWLNELIKPFEDDEVIATYGRARGDGINLERILRGALNRFIIDIFMPGANRAIKKSAFFELNGYKIPENQKNLWEVMKEELYNFPKNLRKKGKVVYAHDAISYQPDRNLNLKEKEGGAKWEFKGLKSQAPVAIELLKYTSSIKKKKLKERLRGLFRTSRTR